MLSHSITRNYRTALAGAAASVLAALAIAAPAGAAETSPTAASFSSGADQVGINYALPAVQRSALPAVQHNAFDVTRPGG